MKILIISDAWKPQINGVVRTLETTARVLEQQGHKVLVVGPDEKRFLTVAVPFYPEIKLEFFSRLRLSRVFREFAPDFIHIATEGPLGWGARNLCLKQDRPFTTSYHTRFPEYLSARSPRFLKRLVHTTAYAILRRFHAPAGAVMVATKSIERELQKYKFHHIVRWSRGVDTDVFKAVSNPAFYQNLPRPVLLYVGRVAVEKNLPAFLNLKTSGSLVVIGDGPDRDSLRNRYPHAHFLGAKQGTDLAAHYAAADLFVFPSKTDTFGLVLLEACASGLRIAAYPVPGPADIFADHAASSFVALDDDLQKAVDRALALPDDRKTPRDFVASYSWQACATQFFTHLQAPSPKAIRKVRRWRRLMEKGQRLWGP